MTPTEIIQIIEQRRAELERDLAELTGRPVMVLAYVHGNLDHDTHDLAHAALRAHWEMDVYRVPGPTVIWVSPDHDGRTIIFVHPRQLRRNGHGTKQAQKRALPSR